MKYLSLELSNKLQKKGLVSESGYWVSSLKTSDNNSRPEDDGKRSFVVSSKQEANYYWFSTPAYRPSDVIMNKDNAIKLWGEELIGSDPGKVKNWYAKVILVLYLHLSGKDIEKAIEEAL